MSRTRIHPQDAPDLQTDTEAGVHSADTTAVHGIADTSLLSTTSHVHAGADITSGTVADARIDAALARDSEVTTAVTTHEGAADPHTGYVREADANWVDLTDGGASTLHSHAATGAPADADYLVGTAHAGLSAEIVVGATPGGELGNTWASPTVDASHSGSTHAATQAAAEATAAAALTGHTGDTSDAHDASAVSFVPAGAIAATDVQAAIEELDTEKSGTGHTHSTDFGEAGDIAASAFGDTAAAGATGEVADAGHRHAREADPVTAHAAAGDPHTGYRLESADHSHASTGLQAGTVAHTALTSVGIDDHHARDHAINAAVHTGTLDDAQIPAGITRDAEAAAAYAAIGHTHAAGLALTTVEVDLGAAPLARRAGRFTIAGTGMTIGKAVLIQQASGPYTGKGTRADEAEMDLVVVTGKVTSATVIECFWNSQSPVRGNFKMDYVVSS